MTAIRPRWDWLAPFLGLVILLMVVEVRAYRQELEEVRSALLEVGREGNRATLERDFLLPLSQITALEGRFVPADSASWDGSWSPDGADVAILILVAPSCAFSQKLLEVLGPLLADGDARPKVLVASAAGDERSIEAWRSTVSRYPEQEWDFMLWPRTRAGRVQVFATPTIVVWRNGELHDVHVGVSTAWVVELLESSQRP